jgi:hypothetical protein
MGLSADGKGRRSMRGGDGARKAGRGQRRRPARIPLAEDWLRTAAVKDRIAGFLRAARPLSAWLDTNVGPSGTRSRAGYAGRSRPDEHRVAAYGQGR